MSNDPTWNATVSQVLSATAVSISEANPSHTIRPAPGATLHPAPAPGTGLVDFGEVLGEGGMGVVRAATQASLERPVAVKSLRSTKPPAHVVHRLLQEAWVTGLLDHPNILPVHDIVHDEQNLPHIVMKRVEGRPWSTYARDADTVLEGFGSEDLLDWNLRTFMTVCNAAHFAHDRGILHRDLKPDNVMIGQFGEVWVLDWGIAVGLDDRWGPKIPLAAKERQLAGTPRYLAPEMASCRGTDLGPATDVYLLGGILHYLLAGAPPHLGATLKELLEGIPGFTHRIPDTVPAVLRATVARALAFDPKDRHASAVALRDEVASFLAHRGALALVREAMHGLLSLEQAIDNDAPRREVHALHAQTSFGFAQALREWPTNAEAKVGQRRAGMLMVRYELDQRHTSAASLFLEGLDEPPHRLRLELNNAIARELEADQELAELRRDADPNIGVRTRMFVATLLATTWVIAPILIGWLHTTTTWTRLIASSVGLLAAVLAIGIWAKDSLSKTAINRSIYAMLLLVPLGQLMLDVSTLLLDVQPLHSFILRVVLWAVVSATLAATIDKRFWLTAHAYAVVSIFSAAFPSFHAWLMAFGNLVLLGTIVWVWGPNLWARRG